MRRRTENPYNLLLVKSFKYGREPLQAIWIPEEGILTWL